MQLGSAAPDQYSVWEDSRPASASAKHLSYEPRQPSSGILHQVVKLHLETFLEEAGGGLDGAGLPRFIEKELRSFLTCGALGRGYLSTY